MLKIGPVSTCADTDTATHTAPHAAISERVAISNGHRLNVSVSVYVSAPHKWTRSFNNAGKLLGELFFYEL